MRGSVAVDNVQHTPSLLALPVYGVIRIDIDVAFRPGGTGHIRCWVVRSCKRRFRRVAGRDRKHGKYNCPIGASVSWSGDRKSFHHKRCLASLGASTSGSFGRIDQAVHTEYKALDGSGWVDIGDLRTGLRGCRRGREHKQDGETQNFESSHAYILPEVRCPSSIRFLLFLLAF